MLPFLLLILILLLAAIAATIRYSTRSEQKWQAERRQQTRLPDPPPENKKTDAETANDTRPVRGNIVPQRERRRTKNHYQNLHQELSEQLAQAHAQTQRKPKSRKSPAGQAELPIFPETDGGTEEAPAPAVDTDLQTISLTDTLHVRQPYANRRPTAAPNPLQNPTAKQPPEQITDQDPTLRRFLNSRKNRRQSLRPARKTDPSVISGEDIRANLLNRTWARNHLGEKHLLPAAKLDTIAEEEILNNLKKSDSPIARQHKPFRQTAERASIIPHEARIVRGEPVPKQLISSRFTPFRTEPPAENTVETPQPDSAAVPDRLQPSAPTAPAEPLPYDKPAAFSGSPFRADPSLSERVPTHTPDIELGHSSEWQHTLRTDTLPPAEPVVRTPAAPDVPSAPLPPQHPLDDTRYSLPLDDLLQPPQYNSQAAVSDEELVENGIIIEEKLSEFRVKVKVVDAAAGPVITRYEIEPDIGVRGNSVINLEKDLARSLGVAAIRVVETIPGKTCMGLELPNPQRQTIRLSEVLRADAFRYSPSKLTLALGQDITGQPVVTDLAKAPHLLVAGTTGSGKSVGVNAMILSMLFKASPADVRLIMIDPKMLELSIYEGIPHLLAPVVTDMKLAANALTWCVNEMEKRYRLMSHIGVRNLAGYNQKIQEAARYGHGIANPFSYTPDDPEPLEKLPHIVVIVDEFADLMMVAGKKIEELIARLAQKARAAGIHLILATQRPSVDVITGLIKANIPTRIAFQVSSKVDSRTILDQMGAENLLGNGDMLFLPPGTAYPQRVHGAFVEDTEVHRIVEYLKRFGEPDYIDDILTAGTGSDDIFSNANSGHPAGGSGTDPLFDDAVAFVISSGKATISSIQRNFRIGYNRAANLVEAMESEGILSPADANGKRTILARRNSDG